MVEHPISAGEVPFEAPNAGKPTKTWYQVVGSLETPNIPLIALHGGPGAGHEYLAPLTDLYERHGIPIIFYDQIGCGRSTHFREKMGDESFWTFNLFCLELDNLIDDLGLRERGFCLFGQSWGGILGGVYASRQPRGLRKLILSSAPASVPLCEQGVQRLLSQLPPEVRRTIEDCEKRGDYVSPEFEKASAVFYERHVCRIDPPPDELQRSFANLKADPTSYMTIQGPSEFVVIGSIKRWEGWQDAHKIQVETLLLNGKHDEITDVCVEPWFRHIAKVRWVTFENSSHMTHFEDRQRFMEGLAVRLANLTRQSEASEHAPIEIHLDLFAGTPSWAESDAFTSHSCKAETDPHRYVDCLKGTRACGLTSSVRFVWDKYQKKLFENFLKTVGLNFKNSDIAPLLVQLNLDGWDDVENDDGDNVHSLIEEKVRRKLRNTTDEIGLDVLAAVTYGSKKDIQPAKAAAIEKPPNHDSDRSSPVMTKPAPTMAQAVEVPKTKIDARQDSALSQAKPMATPSTSKASPTPSIFGDASQYFPVAESRPKPSQPTHPHLKMPQSKTPPIDFSFQPRVKTEHVAPDPFVFKDPRGTPASTPRANIKREPPSSPPRIFTGLQSPPATPRASKTPEKGKTTAAAADELRGNPAHPTRATRHLITRLAVLDSALKDVGFALEDVETDGSKEWDDLVDDLSTAVHNTKIDVKYLDELAMRRL